MADNYNKVYVLSDDESNYKEINPEYVYLTIPAEYVCVYHKILTYMADFGKTIVDDCNALCKGNSKNIISCWNLFQSAIACYNLNRKKEADVFINYIKKQLDIIYKGSNNTVYNSYFPVSITEDGKLKAIVSCGNDTKFIVDVETGDLYQKYLDSKNDNNVYTINEDNLVVTNNSEQESE